MRSFYRISAEAVVFVLVFSASVMLARAEGPSTHIISRPGAEGAADRAAVAAAVGLLPEIPQRIAVIDVRLNRQPMQDRLLTLDAFTVKGNQVIYVVEQSALLHGARAGSAIHRAMLATVLWHEMAHLRGATERDARLAEEDLCRRFVRDGRIDALTGLRYLQALVSRPDDELLALK